MLKNFRYSITIQKADEGGYIAFVPSLPGCMTQGETFRETKQNIKDAVEGYLSVFKEDRLPGIESLKLNNFFNGKLRLFVR